MNIFLQIKCFDIYMIIEVLKLDSNDLLEMLEFFSERSTLCVQIFFFKGGLFFTLLG
jgi:hypothetical protein